MKINPHTELTRKEAYALQDKLIPDMKIYKGPIAYAVMQQGGNYFVCHLPTQQTVHSKEHARELKLKQGGICQQCGASFNPEAPTMEERARVTFCPACPQETEASELQKRVEDWTQYLHEIYEPPVMLDTMDASELVLCYESASKMFKAFADNVRSMNNLGGGK